MTDDKQISERKKYIFLLALDLGHMRDKWLLSGWNELSASQLLAW